MTNEPTTMLVVSDSQEAAACSGVLYSDAGEQEAQRLLADTRSFLRKVGRQRLLARLEKLVNEDKVGFEGARWVFRTVFGGDIMAVKDR